ncbi:MAG TPA: PqqD family protein [bacterium]|nr:PqqD family protein [bacterium]
MELNNIWKTKFQRAPDCAFREIEGETFIVSSSTGGVHLLNSVGSFIWNRLELPATPEEIAGAVTDEFDVDSGTAQKDILDFFTSMIETSIVRQFESGESDG